MKPSVIILLYLNTIVVNIPNLISLFRVLLIPLLVYLAWQGQTGPFLVLLVLAFLSDTIDGYLARKLKQTSALGSSLDSWGDFALFITIPLCVWWLWPGLLRQELLFVMIALTSLILPVAAGFFKYKRLTSYHTWAAKAAATLLCISLLILLGGGSPLPFRIAVVIFAVAEVEELAITACLPRWHRDIHGVWHAVRLMRKEKQRQRESGPQP